MSLHSDEETLRKENDELRLKIKDLEQLVLILIIIVPC
jgi:hypothetical protein